VLSLKLVPQSITGCQEGCEAFPRKPTWFSSRELPTFILLRLVIGSAFGQLVKPIPLELARVATIARR
jgi:hypothetical protein